MIVTALDALPKDLDPELRIEAEAHLLHLAATHPSDELRRLAKHLHEVVDPDAAEAALAKRLAKEEDDAAKAASVWMPLTLRPSRSGCCAPLTPGTATATTSSASTTVKARFFDTRRRVPAGREPRATFTIRMSLSTPGAARS